MSQRNYSNLIFDKGVKKMMEKRKLLQQMLLGKLDIYMQKIDSRSM
jgi:hypothetical protein